MTKDLGKRSFLSVAADSSFSLQNLPLGVFSTRANSTRRVGARLGDFVIDLAFLEARGLLGTAHPVFQGPDLTAFMALGHLAWAAFRARLMMLLGAENPVLRDDSAALASCLVAVSEATLYLPAPIGDYTDFYSSMEHARNVGIMFRDKENPLLPNWKHLPVGYHGRSSSIVPSGTPILRPHGQVKGGEEATPSFRPCAQLDFELEVAFWVGKDSELGLPIPLSQASEYLFGVTLLNDWSARDIQRWEYVPLGPFVSKSFATSISPWIVSLEALAPFAVEAVVQDPEPLAYLRGTRRVQYDMQLEVLLKTGRMQRFERISLSNFRNLYWTMDQQLAHHTVTGCNVRRGDLMASGTISGADPSSYGSMLELAWAGTKPLRLQETGESRIFLEDGDEILLRAWCQGDGYRVGLGDVTGVVLPARKI